MESYPSLEGVLLYRFILLSLIILGSLLIEDSAVDNGVIPTFIRRSTLFLCLSIAFISGAPLMEVSGVNNGVRPTVKRGSLVFLFVSVSSNVRISPHRELGRR